MKSDKIFNISDIGIKKILSNDKIKFICKECGKESIYGFKYFKSIKFLEICKKCKTIETTYKRYGVDNVNKLSSIRLKIEKTNLERYGCKNQIGSKQTREKIKKTVQEKYGVDNVFSIESIKQKIFKNKDYKEIRKKINKTNLERYGYTVPLKNKSVKEKLNKTNLERYGYKWFTYNQESMRLGMIKMYGVEKILQIPEIHKRQLSSFNHKTRIKTINENLHYQTKPELECIQYCQSKNIHIIDGPSIKYFWNNSTHIYHIDFETPKYIIEIKGNHGWYKEDIESGKINAKNNAAIEYAKSINKKFLFLLEIKDYSKYILE